MPVPDATLTPDEIRQLLRECVTVVKPGETLIIRVPMDTHTYQIHEYQERADTVLADHGNPFRVFVLPAEELGVAEAGKVTVTHKVAPLPDSVFAEQLHRVVTHEWKRQGWKWPPT